MEPVLDSSLGEECAVLVEPLREDGGRCIGEAGVLDKLRGGTFPGAGPRSHEVEDGEHAYRNLALAQFLTAGLLDKVPATVGECELVFR